jgi:double-stranded uracil-DNA glycosylase
METVAPILPDTLAPDLRIVFCGTAAGRMSAATQSYYAHPQNQFWRALAIVGLTPRQLQPAEYPLLLHYGLGLTDLAKYHAGMDAAIPRAAFDRAAVQAKIQLYQPAMLAFTSKNAARIYLGRPVHYGLQAERIGNTQLFVLPSPSPAARNHWNLAYWQELASLPIGQRPLEAA